MIMSSIKYKLGFARLNTKFFKYFYDEKSLLCEELEKLSEKGAPIDTIDPQGYISKLEKNYLKEKEIIEATEEEKSLTEYTRKIIESIKITEYQNKLTVSFDINTTATMYHSYGRGSKTRVENIHITKDSVFELRNYYNSYENEKFIFSIIESDTKAFSLSVEPSNTGIKGDIILKVVELCDNKIIVDNCAKYFDTTKLLKGISL